MTPTTRTTLLVGMNDADTQTLTTALKRAGWNCCTAQNIFEAGAQIVNLTSGMLRIVLDADHLGENACTTIAQIVCGTKGICHGIVIGVHRNSPPSDTDLTIFDVPFPKPFDAELLAASLLGMKLPRDLGDADSRWN